MWGFLKKNHVSELTILPFPLLYSRDTMKISRDIKSERNRLGCFCSCWLCAALWDGALISCLPGFQRKELDLTMLFQVAATSLIPPLTFDGVSAGSNSAEVWLGISKVLFLCGHIPRTDKVSIWSMQRNFHSHLFIIIIFSPVRMTPVAITRQPCWISVAVTNKI